MTAYRYMGRADYHAQHDAAYALLYDVLDRCGCENKEIVHDARGKPFLKDSDLFISLTHCDGLAACITEPVPCGIDAERFDRKVTDRIIKRVCSPEETALINSSSEPEKEFIRLWTLKEAYSKVDGRGIGVISSIHFPERAPVIEAYGCIFTTFELDEHFLTICLKQDN